LGQRISKTTDEGTATYLYGNDGKLLVESGPSNDFVEYIFLGEQLLASYQEFLSPPDPPPAPVIIDNGDVGTSPTGSWSSNANNNDYGEDYLLANTGATNTYTWAPTLLGTDIYEVYAWWPAKNNQSSNVPYTITHSGQQDVVYADHSANGGQWNLLGTYFFADDGTESVQVSAVNGKTVADAVKFVKVVPPELPIPVAEMYYVHNDHLGTPKRMTDQSGQIVWNSSQTPFGTTSVNEDVDGDGIDVTLNVRFPGQYYDSETGLHYNYYRDYDPSTGRYLQSDPIGLAGGLNTYGYVGGNPVNRIDSLGLWSTAAHNYFIDQYFNGAPANIRDWIKESSAYADSLPYHGDGSTHMHAMRNSHSQSEHQACQDMMEYIQSKIYEYNEAINQWAQSVANGQRGSSYAKGKQSSAFHALGMALHTAMDFTSPAHAGFQVWEYRNTFSHGSWP